MRVGHGILSTRFVDEETAWNPSLRLLSIWVQVKSAGKVLTGVFDTQVLR
jgi:hypothetical protein